MFKSYLTAALRNVRRYKGYAFINIFGLAVGLAACLLIALYVRFELSYDRMHEKADRIVRLEMDVERSGMGASRWKVARLPMGPDLTESVPEIENMVRIWEGGQYSVQSGDIRFYEDRVMHVDPSLFEIFDFDVLTGSETGLGRPGTILLAKSTARKYFNDIDPVGQVLKIGDAYSTTKREYEVVGTYEDMPANSHFRADMMASIATVVADAGDRIWNRLSYTYLLLAPGVMLESLESRFDAYERNGIDEQAYGKTNLQLRPLTDIHLFGGSAPDIQPQGDIRYVWIFSAIATLILIIACINYMNLATARSAQRAREVGVRKVVGANRGQLIRQFLGESILFTGVALVFAIALAQLALPFFNSLMDRPLTLEAGDLQIFLGLLFFSLVVGLVAGSYPAALLSRMKPSLVLKGGGSIRSGVRLRRGLVVLQFVISMALIVGTVVIDRQLEFVSETNLGYENEQTLTLHTRGHLGDDVGAFEDALASVSTVSQVSMSSSVPGIQGWRAEFGPDQIDDYTGEEGITFDLVWVDNEFVETLGLEIIAGQRFDESSVSDRGEAVLINETAVKQLGWDNPIGKRFQQGQRSAEVVGVFRDYHNQSMKFEIKPMMLWLSDQYLQYASITLDTQDMQRSLAQIENVWDQFIPGLPFQYSFLDDEFDAMYRNEQRLASLFGSFATVAIFIAVLGLFGLAAYTAQQRTKEIGIRKVLGASVSGLVVMLSKEFVRLVLVAFVVAAPLAYYAMENWLSSFAYRIDIGPGIFLLSGGLALLIALGTVSWQAIRAATADPVKSLRYE